jgi:hypothetical protein
MWVVAIHAGCGDRVLGGITPDSGAMAPGCEAYVPGSLVHPGVSSADYCAAVQRVCGFGDGSSGAGVYLSLGDCLEKYGGGTDAQRSCGAGRVCEAEARASSSLCEGVVSSCAGL